MNHMQIFFPVGICVGPLFGLVEIGGVERAFHVLAFFQMPLILLFICLFGMIYVLFGVHTNEKIKIRAIDVCESHTQFWCMPYTYEMGKRFSSWWSQEWILWHFFRYAVRRYVVHVWCVLLFGIIVCIKIERSCEQTHTHARTHSDRERERNRERETKTHICGSNGWIEICTDTACMSGIWCILP